MINSGDLTDRAMNPRGSDTVEGDTARIKGKAKKTEDDPHMRELAARLAAARAVPLLRAPDLHCAHCFGEGREAAIRAFEAPVDGA